MKILISGSSGMVGSALAAGLQSTGHQVVRLVRPGSSSTGANTITWDPDAGRLDHESLAGVHAIVNLNGSNLGDGRWTERRKRELRTSRLRPTELLVEAIARLDPPPVALVNASAVGYYGDRGEEVLDESAGPGKGFLAELTQDWEAMATASDHTRVVLLRLGMVVGRGGALGRMLPAFRIGLGGPIGSGRQWWPWIGIDDVVGAVERVLSDRSLSGPLNLVAPHEVRCRDFTSALGHVLGRPAVVPLPAVAARLALGEMAESVLLASTRVRPSALIDAGFEFAFPLLEPALRHALSRIPHRVA